MLGSVRGCVKREFVQTEPSRELRACCMVLLLSEVCCWEAMVWRRCEIRVFHMERHPESRVCGLWGLRCWLPVLLYSDSCIGRRKGWRSSTRRTSRREGTGGAADGWGSLAKSASRVPRVRAPKPGLLAAAMCSATRAPPSGSVPKPLAPYVARQCRAPPPSSPYSTTTPACNPPPLV